MIKVAIIRNCSPLNKYGGIRKHCTDLYAMFKGNSKVSVLPINDIPGVEIPIIKKRYFNICPLYKYLKSVDCDIVHIHGFASFDVIQTIVLARFLGKKIVYSPHFHPFKYLQHPLLGRLYFYLILRPFLPLVSAIVTISKVDYNFFRDYCPRVFQIAHPYEYRHETNNVCKKKNMILFVGRNEENKGLDHLYRLPNKYEVHCVTKGVLKRQDFIIHENVSDMELDRLYAEASLVVVPSRYEAFSYVVLEALAHGTPVVMSDSVRIADYLDDCRGYKTFPYKDYNAFIKAVEDTIGTEVDSARIIGIFDKNVIAQKYESVYCNLY